jgi:diguanylate cyclase (GGDEF)-like protein
LERINELGTRGATAPTAWRSERRAQAGAIRAIRESDGGPVACAGAVATGAREALGASSCAVVVMQGGRPRVMAEAGAGRGVGAELDVDPELASALRGAPARRVRADEGTGRDAPAGDRVTVPVRFEQRVWGALSACCPEGAPEDAADILAPFAELMSLSLSTHAARRRLSVLAATDTLTGLPNRRAFDAALVTACECASESGTPVSLAVLDLDRFKDVNDRYGHRAGDEVLREAARRLAAVARAEDVVARIGGEEFGWILPGLAAPSAAGAVERARQAVAGTPFADAGCLTISAGVTDLAAAGTAGRMLEAADTMLYRAKAEGRDAVRPSPGLALAAEA